MLAQRHTHTHTYLHTHTHMLACTHTHMLAHTAGFPIVPVRIGLPGAAAASPSLAPLPPSSSKPSAVGAARAPVRVRAVAFFLRGFRARGLVRFATSSSSNFASTFATCLFHGPRHGRESGVEKAEWSGCCTHLRATSRRPRAASPLVRRRAMWNCVCDYQWRWPSRAPAPALLWRVNISVSVASCLARPSCGSLHKRGGRPRCFGECKRRVWQRTLSSQSTQPAGRR